MFQVRSDKTTNLLTIGYGGTIGFEEAKRCADEIEREVRDLVTGFRLLTDLSGLDSMDLACVPEIERMMDLLDEKGVELVVRIIPDPRKDIGSRKMLDRNGHHQAAVGKG